MIIRWVLLLLVLASVLTFDYYSSDWGRGGLQAIGTNTIERQLDLVEVRQ